MKCLHEKLLEIMPLGVPVSPDQIDKHLDHGPYSSKNISFLRRLGFEIETKKEGKNVISYTIINEPANASDIRSGRVNRGMKVRKEKPIKAKKEKSVAAPIAIPTREEPVATLHSDSYSVDPDWDNTDISDLRLQLEGSVE